MYSSTEQVLTNIGKGELARITGGKLDLHVSADVLALMINGAPASAFVSDEAESASAAIELMQLELDTAQKMINGYIAGRYTLPLSNTLIEQSPLPRVCVHLVRYGLTLSPDEQVTRDYNSAMQVLRDIAKGVITLGENDPVSNGGTSIKVRRSTRSNLLEGFGR